MEHMWKYTAVMHNLFNIVLSAVKKVENNLWKLGYRLTLLLPVRYLKARSQIKSLVERYPSWCHLI